MVLSRILRAGEGKTVKRQRKITERVNALESSVEGLTDGELRARTQEFRDEFQKLYAEAREHHVTERLLTTPGLEKELRKAERQARDEVLDEMLPEAFATAREASRRVLGQRHYDEQVMGSAALHFGHVAEMRTGEGKTLTCVLPAYLNAISGHGVHVVTTNDYLAARDAEWMGRVHRFLGLEVGVIIAGQSPDVRRQQYQADITYGTNNEFGFDYLRDNMAWSMEECVQRGHAFAIVDEVDSILIDEARTPLIISGPADQSSRWYTEFARMVPSMKTDTHYEVDERKRTVGVTEEGVAYIEDQLGIENLYEAANTPLVGYLNNALKAKELYKKDKDYIVRDGEVLIVDEFTGRILAGRRYNEGMHQAIEAKEGVEIKAENQTLATITLQNYFRLYHKLAGMTGTAETEAAEFHSTYELGVVPIPTHRPMIRADRSDLIYKTEEAKFTAVAEDIAERNQKGQPVLVGTTSVERSEYLSKQLVKLGVPHSVLNAKHHDKEAAIIAAAGHLGAVTVSTNMAGRGTDIMLGGNPEHIAESELRSNGLDPVDTPEEWIAALPGAMERAREVVAEDADRVRELGGLYVLGTERHESRRIDNQLRGRSGRQGDPGESRFYLSLGDELMRRFNATMVERVMQTLRVPDDVPIEAKMVTRAIQSAQGQVEGQNHEIRKNVLKYDEVMDKQRKVIYAERLRVLAGEDLSDQTEHMITDVVTAYVNGATSDGYAEDWDHEQLWTALKTLYPVSLTWEQVADRAEEEREDLTGEFLRKVLIDDAQGAYRAREAEIDGLVGEGAMRDLERRVVLSVLDRKWREHLYEMDYLKEGIGLRAMAQRDPLIEYKREGFEMFTAMLEALKEESIGFLFNLQVERAEDDPEQAEQAQAQQAQVQAEREVRAARAAEAARVAQAAQAAARTSPDKVPSALRAKGLDAPTRQQQLTFSGPAEDGAATTRNTGGAHNGDANGQGGGGTRRERRAAERADAKKKGRNRAR